VTDLGMF